jgi:hypothetical protein
MNIHCQKLCPTTYFIKNILIIKFVHKLRHPVWGGGGGIPKMTLDDREGGGGLRRPKKG